MFKVSFVPDYQNCGIKEFESKEDAERLVQRARADLVSEWLKVNAGKNAEEYFADPHTVDVQIVESVDIHALWDLNDCNSLAEPARSELWDAISSLQRANFTEDEIVYQIESFMGKI